MLDGVWVSSCHPMDHHLHSPLLPLQKHVALTASSPEAIAVGHRSSCQSRRFSIAGTASCPTETCTYMSLLSARRWTRLSQCAVRSMSRLNTRTAGLRIHARCAKAAYLCPDLKTESNSLSHVTGSSHFAASSKGHASRDIHNTTDLLN